MNGNDRETLRQIRNLMRHRIEIQVERMRRREGDQSVVHQNRSRKCEGAIDELNFLLMLVEHKMRETKHMTLVEAEELRYNSPK